MNADKLKTGQDMDEELDDPYIHILSTEEFIENVERASQEEKNDGVPPHED